MLRALRRLIGRLNMIIMCLVKSGLSLGDLVIGVLVVVLVVLETEYIEIGVINMGMRTVMPFFRRGIFIEIIIIALIATSIVQSVIYTITIVHIYIFIKY